MKRRREEEATRPLPTPVRSLDSQTAGPDDETIPAIMAPRHTISINNVNMPHPMCHASLESTKKVVCMLLNLRMVVTWFALRNLPGLFLMPSLVMDVPPTKRTLSVLLVLIIHSSILGPSHCVSQF